MKNKLVNKKVVNSIGSGIMAFVTATSPALTVLAEESDPNDAVQTAVGEAEKLCLQQLQMSERMLGII